VLPTGGGGPRDRWVGESDPKWRALADKWAESADGGPRCAPGASEGSAGSTGRIPLGLVFAVGHVRTIHSIHRDLCTPGAVGPEERQKRAKWRHLSGLSPN